MINRLEKFPAVWKRPNGQKLTGTVIGAHYESRQVRLMVHGGGSRARIVPFDELLMAGDEEFDLDFNNTLNAYTEEELKHHQTMVENKFNTLEILIRGVAAGTLHGLVIRGEGGIGKTYTVVNTLQDVIADGDDVEFSLEDARGKYFKRVSGHMTPMQLFNNLHKNNTSDTVMVFDDCDGVFKNPECLNVLKAAMDTNHPRVVSWNSSSSLAAVDMFRYEGTIIIMTNDRLQSKDPHTKAFLDRVHSMDLTLNPLERILRLKFVAKKIQEQRGISDELTEQCLDWLLIHSKAIGNKLSIRTFLKVLDMAALTDNWKSLAEVTLIIHEVGA